MTGVAEALEAGTACGIVCITMDPWGLIICCPGADTICRMLPESTTKASKQNNKEDVRDTRGLQMNYEK